MKVSFGKRQAALFTHPVTMKFAQELDLQPFAAVGLILSIKAWIEEHGDHWEAHTIVRGAGHQVQLIDKARDALRHLYENEDMSEGRLFFWRSFGEVEAEKIRAEERAKKRAEAKPVVSKKEKTKKKPAKVSVSAGEKRQSKPKEKPLSFDELVTPEVLKEFKERFPVYDGLNNRPTFDKKMQEIRDWYDDKTKNGAVKWKSARGVEKWLERDAQPFIARYNLDVKFGNIKDPEEEARAQRRLERSRRVTERDEGPDITDEERAAIFKNVKIKKLEPDTVAS